MRFIHSGDALLLARRGVSCAQWPAATALAYPDPSYQQQEKRERGLRKPSVGFPWFKREKRSFEGLGNKFRERRLQSGSAGALFWL
jgi:hypothetical protein